MEMTVQVLGKIWHYDQSGSQGRHCHISFYERDRGFRNMLDVLADVLARVLRRKWIQRINVSLPFFPLPQAGEIMSSIPVVNASRTQGRYWSMPSPVTSAVARDQFEILYPTIRGFLLSQFEAHSMPQDAIEYFTHVRRHPPPSQGSKKLTGI